MQNVAPQHAVGKLAEIARVQSWWSYKFSPVLGTFYATACLVGMPVWPLIPRLLVLLVALVVGATYVSVINDWSDREVDRAGGKYNRTQGKSVAFPATVVAVCLVMGLGLGVYFYQCNPVSGWLYLGSWAVFSCYSLPPIRLKKRGLGGVLADGSGAHFFPQLLTVSLVSAWQGQQVPLLWYVAVGAWALACGMRNIMLHQLGDVEADEAANVNTWVRVVGPKVAQRFGELMVFPIEVLGFALLLMLSQQVWPVVLLGVYLALEGFKWRLWQNRPRILEPDTRVLMNEYYEVFYPLGFLLVLSARQPIDLLVLVMHVLLFASCFGQTAKHLLWAVSLTARKALGR